jgi:hypothetical protein
MLRGARAKHPIQSGKQSRVFSSSLEGTPKRICLCLANDSAYPAPGFMRVAILVLLIVVLTGVGSPRSIDAKPPGDPLDGYAVFGDLTTKEASTKARKMAETDFAQNVYRIFVAGKPVGPNAHDDYLLKKYGVQVTSIAGCLISDGIAGAKDGYNSTMKPLLNRKFGRDIFKEAEEANRK